jgi:hypothetical protein
MWTALEPDEDAFAGEVNAQPSLRRGSTVAPRLAAAVGTGVRAGLVVGAIVFVVYFALNSNAGLPWVRLGSAVALYGPGIGILLAVLVESFVMLNDRIARLGFGLVAIANPVTAGALGGILAGLAPGAIAVVVFGSYRGPFVGTWLIAFALICGAVMIAAPLAIRARRAQGGGEDRGAITIATVGATLILCVVAAMVAPVIVGSAFDQVAMTDAMDDFGGGLVGAVAGAAGGAVIGVFIGIVVALGRTIRPVISSSRE